MLTNQVVQDRDNYFFVDANGVMVTNNWVEVDNSNDDSDNAPATVWYYLQANGKAYKGGDNTSFKTINGKNYAFSTDAKMLFGWVDGNSNRVTSDDAWQNCEYYLGSSNDGARATSKWVQLHVNDSAKDDPDQDYWFYFQANGKKYAAKRNGQTINGKKYAFGEFGNMLTGWVASDSNTPDAAEYRNFAGSGEMKSKAWFKAVPDKAFDLANSEDGESKELWYYADNKGFIATSEIKTINGRKYAFNEKGAMLTGVWFLNFNADGKITGTTEIDSQDKLNSYTKLDESPASFTRAQDKNGIYYFGEESDGVMKTGNVNVTVDGDSYAFKFSNSGNKGVGIDKKDGSVYYVNGKKLKADSDEKYKVYAVDPSTDVVYGVVANSMNLVNRSYNTDKMIGDKEDFSEPSGLMGNGYKYVVVSTSGALQGKGEKKDGNDVYLVTGQDKYLKGAYIKK